MKRKDTDGKRVIVAKLVREVWAEMPIGSIFHGYDIKERCTEKNPLVVHTYEDTFLRCLRRLYSGCYEVLNGNESLYKKVVAK